MIQLPLDPGLSALLPDWHAVAGVLGVAAALAMCLGIGALAIGRDSEPEVQVVGGWGLLCLVLTLWGAMSTASLRVPLATVALLAASAFGIPRLRTRLASPTGAGIVLLLSMPLWLVMLPVSPSQVDTWLNLLPNAAYLFDHGHFPSIGGAPSFSFLPGAPYNTQFIAFAASAVSGSLAASAMSWFNVALASVAGIAIARQLPGWGETARRPVAAFAGAAAGLLLAVPLNPGFDPRYCFSSYGEWPLAVATMLAGLLAARVVGAGRQGTSIRTDAVSLALVLAALVNTKQSGLGLLLAVGLSLLAVGWRELRGVRRLALLGPLLPALVLYLVWQLHVRQSGAAELQIEPLAAWNIRLLPTTLISMAHEAVKHPGLFVLEAAVLGGAIRALRRARHDFPATMLHLSAGTILLDNAYILASYVVHSDPVGAAHAHSYYRYNTQLSLLAILALAIWLRRPAEAAWARLSGATRHRAQLASVALVLLLPLAFWPALRFDLDAPQPTIAALRQQLSGLIRNGDRVALILPGDRDDALGSFLRGEILFMRPRIAVAAFATYGQLDPATLRAMGRSGFNRILLSCAPDSWSGTDAPSGALLGDDGGTWRRLAAWRYPRGLRDRHFAGLIPRIALCAEP